MDVYSGGISTGLLPWKCRTAGRVSLKSLHGGVCCAEATPLVALTTPAAAVNERGSRQIPGESCVASTLRVSFNSEIRHRYMHLIYKASRHPTMLHC
jgi:hypothetical protein